MCVWRGGGCVCVCGGEVEIVQLMQSVWAGGCGRAAGWWMCVCVCGGGGPLDPGTEGHLGSRNKGEHLWIQKQRVLWIQEQGVTPLDPETEGHLWIHKMGTTSGSIHRGITGFPLQGGPLDPSRNPWVRLTHRPLHPPRPPWPRTWQRVVRAGRRGRAETARL